MPQRDYENEIEKLLSKARIKKPPVPIKKIAALLGARVRTEVLDEEISGLLYKDKKNQGAVIIINKSHPLTRQRFTVGHELSHLFLGHEGKFFVDRGSVIFRDSNSSTGQIEDEKQANSFAAKLLMPQGFLRKDVKRNIDLIDLERIEKLAKKYGVSVQAMTYRLTNLNLIT